MFFYIDPLFGQLSQSFLAPAHRVSAGSLCQHMTDLPFRADPHFPVAKPVLDRRVIPQKIRFQLRYKIQILVPLAACSRLWKISTNFSSSFSVIASMIRLFRLRFGKRLVAFFNMVSKWNSLIIRITFVKFSNPFLIHFPPSSCR